MSAVWREEAVVFSVNGAPLIGILHVPEEARTTGILIVVADGPQYRAGCARQLVLWSRKLQASRYPVLRFDFAGAGDSGGEFRGFTQMDEDIDAAIETLLQRNPQLRRIVLWGECTAASAIMMYAWRNPKISHLVLQNPWVRDESTQATTYLKHYYWHRLTQRSFWRKLFSFKFNPLQSLASIWSLFKKSRKLNSAQTSKSDDWDPNLRFQDKMREGFARFQGQSLFIMSGRSLIGKEFDEAVKSSEQWREIMRQKSVDRLDFERADHTFSQIKYREEMAAKMSDWLQQHAP